MKRRAFTMSAMQVSSSPAFYLSIIGVTVLCFISVWDELDAMGPAYGVYYYFDIFIGLTMFKKLVVLFAALPYVASFCSDWKYQYLKPVVIRTGAKRYVWSKVITCFLSGFLTVFIGVLLFCLLLLLKMPLFPSEDLENIISPLFSPLAEGAFPLLVVLAESFIFSLAAALWTVVGLAVSAFIPSHFVAVTTPVIASYILEEVTKLFPSWLNLYLLTRSADVLQQGPLISFVYFCFVFLLFAALVGCLFDYQVRRRIRNEVV
ncbi:hypothetical protein MUB24_07615 [Lederbergia sp. NSJ-179]|uniref:hypothetical protein n=1 Tax=Lederbergia sp. NSJ-179 TaxID=2931402 RepID=UPI001FD21A0A|nr:hypothetical protein [Lederbergia sp. NSJ-179]MCJ7840774.1 hypothetical protein [Lederbergia sp. NSJ-179]